MVQGSDRSVEAEELIALLESPGWQLFQGYVHREWGAEAYRNKVRQILNNLPTADKAVEAAHYLGRLECAAREIEALLRWPADRLKRLAGESDENLRVSQVV